MYDNILFPLTPHEEIESEKVLEIAETFEAEIHAVYVLKNVAFHNDRFWDQLIRTSADNGRGVQEKLKSKAEERDVDVEMAEIHGNPGKEIVDYAQENNIDFIVMSRNCRGRYKDFLLGSTTKRVIENAETSVLTYSE